MNIKSEIIDKNLCVSCGLCAFNNLATMKMKKGIYIPIFQNRLTNEDDELLTSICPGKGYNIVDIGRSLYGQSPDSKYDYRIGYYKNIGVARSFDDDFLQKSSSGAMMPALALFLLEEKIVDGIITVKFDYTANGPVPKSFIAKSKEDLIEAQGSKYMPIPLWENINDILNFPGKLAVIGTPCQIAGLRLLQSKNENLKNKLKFTMANFCGGFRDYRETERIFQIFNVKKENITYFSYRGNGQPGTMTIQQKNHKSLHIKYPEYAQLTGFIKYYRCRFCVDATGELADISFGDAWLPRFLNTGKKWSLFVCRSNEIFLLLQQMMGKGLVELNTLALDELVTAQKGNLTTKKERQKARYALYRIINKPVPYFDGSYNPVTSNLKLELKVAISHTLMYFLEKIGLYLPIAKIIKRVTKENYEI